MSIVRFNVVIKRCISHYFSNGTDIRVSQNVFLVVNMTFKKQKSHFNICHN